MLKYITILFIILVISSCSKEMIEVDGLKWRVEDRKCHVQFEIINNSVKKVKTSILIKVYTHTRTHNRDHQIIGEKEESYFISANSTERIDESLSILPTALPTQVQLIINKVSEM